MKRKQKTKLSNRNSVNQVASYIEKKKTLILKAKKALKTLMSHPRSIEHRLSASSCCTELMHHLDQSRFIKFCNQRYGLFTKTGMLINWPASSFPGWKEFVFEFKSTLPRSFRCPINLFHPILLKSKTT
jgi:hypothetical protein